MNVANLSESVSIPTMKRLCRKRNHDLILTGLLIVVLMVIWLNMYLTRTIHERRSLVDCSWPCIDVTCKQCVTRADKGDTPVDIMSYLKLKHVQRVSAPRNVTSELHNKDDVVCRRAHFDLDHDSVRYAFFPMKALNCSGTQLFYPDFPVFRLNSSALQGQRIRKCLYFGINRLNDDFHIYTEPFVKESPPFDLVFKQDFVHVKCFFQNDDMNAHKVKSSENNKTTIVRDKGVSTDSNVDIHNDTHVRRTMNITRTAGSDASTNVSVQHKYHPINVVNTHLSRSPIDKQPLNRSLSRHLLAEMEIDADVTNNSDNLYQLTDDLNEMFDPFADYEQEETADYEQLLAQVYPKPEVFKRISDSLGKRKSQKYMDVLIIGLDSMSHLSFQRKLPLTYNYLKYKMKAAIMNGYNIVGDATTAALIPMLTGHFETELPEVRRNQLNSKDVDVYPFIWKQFEKSGYVTLFAEDEPSIGAFNLRLNGFNNPPTDHYMRPFWQVLWNSELRRSSPRYCTGYKPNHQYLLDYLKDFYIKYNKVSKFAFVFGSELTHWDNNPGEYMDRDLRDLLHDLSVRAVLDNTLLIVMGDHGARYSRVRKTVQGKMEERLPMMSLTFPKWFRQRFPHLIENLVNNSDKLTTPFDIYETLSDVLDLNRTHLPADPTSRSFSLLKQIPANRTCASSHIQMHWCTCLNQMDLDPGDGTVLKSAQSILNFINNQTQRVRDKCAELSMKQILHAQLLVPNERVLMFQKSQDDDQRVANFSHNISVDHTHFQVTIETVPNNGLYEATIQVNMTAGSFTVIDDVSRLNLYGNEPLCIQKSYPDLRKYCFCSS